MAPAGSADPGRTARLAIAAVIAAVLLVGVSIAIGRFTSPTVADPATTSAEAGFARDMQVHHLQAVEMSMMIRDLTDDPDVRLLAYDIATSQANQAGQMFGWLSEWGLSQASSEPSMTWMTRPPLGADGHLDHSADPAHEPGAPMPGLATQEQLVALSQLSGVEAEIEFLRLMIAHHEGGVLMAEAVLERTDRRSVVDLASSIVTAQASEIELMESMLAEREADL